MKTVSLATIVVLTVFCTASLCAAADLRAGISAVKFLKIDTGARPLAMGSAYTAVADDISSVHWNPAGLASLEYSGTSFTHNDWLSDVSVENLTYAHFTFSGVFAVNIIYLGMGTLTGRDDNGQLTSGFTASDTGIKLSYGSEVSPGLQAGISFLSYREVIENVTASGFTMDMGLIYNSGAVLSAGLALRNFGPWVKYLEERESLPWLVSAGAGLHLLDGTLTLSMDLSLPNDNAPYSCAGAEYRLADLFCIRGGFTTRTNIGQNITGGFGLNLSGWSVDYTYLPHQALDAAHHFTVSKMLK